MIRLFAGLLDRRGGPSEQDAQALAVGLARRPGGEGAQVLRSGPLAVAYTGPPPAQSGGAFCLLDGWVYEPAWEQPEQELLAAWLAQGTAALEPLRGDFAVLLWDGARGEGLLARDHLGNRALIWHDDGARLRFAGEVADLLAVLPTAPGPDRGVAAHWLAITPGPLDRTLFAGVRRLLGGHALGLGRTPREAQPYWAPRYRGIQALSFEESAERVRSVLSEAIRRRSADSRPAVLLSGGLDSTSVAGLAGAALSPERRPERAYSATFPRHPSVDESALISEVAARIGARWTHAAVARGSLLTGVLAYIDRWSLPPVSPNMFFWLPLFECAREDGVEVLIDGEGGDEVFGLSPYLIADRVRRGRLLGAAALVRAMPGADSGLTRRTVASYVRSYGLMGAMPPWAHAASRRVRGPRHYLPPYLSDRTVAAYLEAGAYDGAGWKRASGPRWWAWMAEATTRGGGPSLAYDHLRRRAALAGLVSRHPIPDVDVIETMLSLPPEHSFDPSLSRPLLRAAVRGLIPESVRARPSKSTFDAIFHEALAGPDLQRARVLVGADARVGEFVDLPTVARELLAAPPPAGPARVLWGVRTWRLLGFECWLRALEDPGEPRATLEQLGLPGPDLALVRA